MSNKKVRQWAHFGYTCDIELVTQGDMISLEMPFSLPEETPNGYITAISEFDLSVKQHRISLQSMIDELQKRLNEYREEKLEE
jgi:hypothetical protein